jgi:hypothetical protein
MLKNKSTGHNNNNHNLQLCRYYDANNQDYSCFPTQEDMNHIKRQKVIMHALKTFDNDHELVYCFELCVDINDFLATWHVIVKSRYMSEDPNLNSMSKGDILSVYFSDAVKTLEELKTTNSNFKQDGKLREPVECVHRECNKGYNCSNLHFFGRN